jgi:hypothetical protein
MRKLKLRPEALKVESFDVPAREEARGTVRGHDSEVIELCNPFSFNSDSREETCCYGTCLNC